MAPRLEPQLAMDEKAISNADLEAALERGLRAQDDVSEAKGVFGTADEEVKGHLAKIDFGPDTALRIGRFRVTKTHRGGGVVSFERKASDRVYIGLADEGQAKGTGSFSGKRARDDDDEDLRATGDVNTDALRGIADRSSEPTPISRNGHQPPVN